MLVRTYMGYATPRTNYDREDPALQLRQMVDWFTRNGRRDEIQARLDMRLCHWPRWVQKRCDNAKFVAWCRFYLEVCADFEWIDATGVVPEDVITLARDHGDLFMDCPEKVVALIKKHGSPLREVSSDGDLSSEAESSDEEEEDFFDC